MLATRLLKQQHRHVEKVFKQLLKEGTDKVSLLKELSDALSAHMVIEQDIFYPEVFAVDSDLIHESYESISCRDQSEAVARYRPGDDSFDARVTACKELIEHHVEEEEEDLFPRWKRRSMQRL